MRSDVVTEALLPPEWPGTYFMGEEEAAAVSAVLKAKSPFRYYGPDLQGFTSKFEGLVRARLGRRHALALNSGTVALAVSVTALGIGPGDEVLVPGYLWPSCLSAVVRAGAIPRLVDVDDTFTVDPNDLRAKIGPHTKAVMVIHMSGSAGRLDDVLAVARDAGIAIIEDVAQANGGTFDGRPLGSFGDVATFSFQLNKTISAGEGGLVASDDDLLSRKLVAAHDLGFPRNAEGRLVLDDPEVSLWGHGGRMSEVAAAVLAAQEAKIERIVAEMQRASRRLYAGLAGVPDVRLRHRPDPAGDNGSFVLMTWPDAEHARRIVHQTRALGVRSTLGSLNNLAMEDWGLHLYYNNRNLVQRVGTNPRGYPWTDSANAFANDYEYGKGALPRADDLFSRSSLIAVSPALTDDAIDRIVDAYYHAARDLG